MNSHNQLPDHVKLKDSTVEGSLLLAAKQTTHAKNLDVKGSLTLISGEKDTIKAVETSRLMSSAGEKINETVSSKKYECSTLIILKLGQNSSCITYTPDPDFKVRDEFGNVAGNENTLEQIKTGKYAGIFYFAATNEDLEAASTNSGKNIKVLYTQKIR